MSMGMPVTVEERDGERSRRGSSETSFASKMYFYGRELCFILALLFTSYAALQNSPPKVSKSPVPVPFFPPSSLVADFYHGQLSPAFERVSESDISFVMYYAPWDAECQATKAQFKAVAQYYYKQVYFAAINCWQPLSECRQQFAKIQHFPVLIAYTQHTKGIQYKGIKEAAHMIKFLESILRPLERVEEPAGLVNLMASHDAVVVGLFDFSGNVGGPGFHTYYSTALKFLERDPYREVGFSIVTSQKAAADLGVFHLPTIRLYLWNETLEYSQDAEFSVEAVVKWISHNIHQVSVWVTPPGVKSLTLSPYVEEGSVLVLFTPRNPLHQHNHHYDLLREVGLEYYNCDNNPWVNDLIHYFSKRRTERNVQQNKAENECFLWKEDRKYNASPPVQVIGAHWINESSCQITRIRKKVSDSCKHWGVVDDSRLVEEVTVSRSKECEGLFSSGKTYPNFGPYSELFQSSQCCKPSHDTVFGENGLKHTSPQTSMLTGRGDDRSASSLIFASSKEKCRRLRRARLVHEPIFIHAGYHRKTPKNFNGLACRTNKTLALLAMDSLQFHQFAEGLGINIMSRTDKSFVVIFNAVYETAYILDQDISKGSLMDFIMNYTEGTLNRSLRSSETEQHTALNQYPDVNLENCRNNASVTCIQELTSKTFMGFVMDPNQAVVVLYHTPYCAFCHGISHFFLTAARYFRTIHNLSFARIDGENNDLPWEFTMHHYPTILFFPAYRKSESHVFPQHLPITVPNLINFILANLGPGMGHLEGMIALCSSWESTQDGTSAKECIDRVRSESLEIIADTLSQYRTANNRLHTSNLTSNSKDRRTLHRQSKHLLLKLQLLKEIHLLLGSIHRLAESSSEYKSIQRNFQVFYSSIKADSGSSVSRQQHSSREEKLVKDEL